MVFIDPLTIMLVAVAASAGIIALYIIKATLGKKNFSDLAVAGFAIGTFDFISGFFMSFLWPFPGALSAYNMLFGDPMLFLGLIMLAGSYMLYKNIDVKVLSYFGFLLGIYLFIETYAIYVLGLEKGVYFLPAFSFYLFSGLAAFLSPLVYANPKKGGKYAYYLLAAFLIIVAFLAMFIGGAGIYGHLTSTP
jgi:putative membrane protein